MRTWVMNEFAEKWKDIQSEGHSAGRFRVYPDHCLDLFLGFDSRGNRYFTLESRASTHSDIDVPSFENVEINQSVFNDTKNITLTLLDAQLSDLFSVMCYDLAESSSRSASDVSAMSIFNNRLSRWSVLLRKRGLHGMSKSEQLGLVGELLTLCWMQEYLKVTYEALVRGWRGPDGDTNDIGYEGHRIEVKAQGATQVPVVKVSSLTQLDVSQGSLYIVHNRLTASDKDISLESLISQIAEALLSNPELGLEFYRKLLLAGYDPDAEYISDCYALEKRTIFRVDEGFPKLIPSNTPNGISNVRYDLSFDMLTEYMVSEKELVDGFIGRI